MTAGNFSVAISGMSFTIIIARHLTPADYGIFSAIISFIFIITDLGELGIGAGLSRFVPPLLKQQNYKDSDQVSKTAFYFQLFVALFLTLLIFGLAGFVASVLFRCNDMMLTNLVRFASLGIFLFMIYNFTNYLVVAREEFSRSFIIQFLNSLPKFLGIILILIITRVSLYLVFAVYLLGAILGILGGLAFTSRNFFRVSGLYPVKKILGFSIYLAANRLFVALFSRLDIVMLSSLGSSYETGLYSAALKVVSIYPLIGGSLATVVAPKYARLTLSEAIGFTKKLFLIILLMIFSVIIIIVFSPVIVSLLYGMKYQGSVHILQLLLWAIIPFLLGIPFNNLLTFNLKKPQVIATASLVQLITIILINLLLIPQIGMLAPVISSFVSSVIALLVSIGFSIYFCSIKK